MNLYNYSKDGTYSSLVTLLKHYNLKYSQLSILKLIERNPHFPSIRTLSDILDELSIENRVYNISPEQFEKIEAPFIAYVKVNNGEFVWVNELNANEAILTTSGFKKRKISIIHFQEIWSGIALFVNEESLTHTRQKGYLFKEFIYTIQSNKFIFFLIPVIALLCLKFFTWNDSSPYRMLFTLANIYGIAISITIIIKTYFDSNLFKRLCSVGKLIDCNSILQSRFAKPFGWLSLGEWGLIFFSTSFVLGITHYFDCRFPLLVLFCAGVAITITSLIFQIWVRKLCILCMLLVAGVWTGFAFLFTDLISSENAITIKGLLVFLSWATVIFFGWIIIRKLMLDSIKYHHLRIKSNPLYATSSILRVMLEESPSFGIPTEQQPIANVTNNTPEYKIDLVLSPSCSHCANTFLAIEELVRKRDDIAIRIIIFPNPDSKAEVELANQLMSIYIQQNFSIFMEVAKVWYSGWFAKTRLCKKKYSAQPDSIAETIVQTHVLWYNSLNIKHLPVVALDGHLLPECYDIKDLKYLL